MQLENSFPSELVSSCAVQKLSFLTRASVCSAGWYCNVICRFLVFGGSRVNVYVLPLPTISFLYGQCCLSQLILGPSSRRTDVLVDTTGAVVFTICLPPGCRLLFVFAAVLVIFATQTVIIERHSQRRSYHLRPCPHRTPVHLRDVFARVFRTQPLENAPTAHSVPLTTGALCSKLYSAST